MGFYLNNKSKVSLYKSEMQRPYFVDKTLILSELFPFVESGNSHICITRPRRFGKTVMANMIGAFFEKDEDTKEIFDQLKISKSPECVITYFAKLSLLYKKSFMISTEKRTSISPVRFRGEL